MRISIPSHSAAYPPGTAHEALLSSLFTYAGATTVFTIFCEGGIKTITGAMWILEYCAYTIRPELNYHSKNYGTQPAD